MKFKHVPAFDLPDLTAEMTDRGRFYSTPEGKKYPSVTTILGAGGDHTWLDEWKERVGEEEVKRVSGQAARRGTAVHELAERYMLNDPHYTKGHMPSNIASFNYIKPFLDKHIGLIAGLELPLYSDFLRAAGRSDCIAKWDGIWSIVDFKTSKRAKTRDDIPNYFMQESCYAYMFFERTGLPVPQIVTVMTVDDSEPLVFVEKTKDHLGAFIELRNKVPF